MMGSIKAKTLLICRTCGISHRAEGNYTISTLEVDSETMAEVDTIALVKECPDCWKKD